MSIRRPRRDVARALTKMSDDEFLRRLRAWKRGEPAKEPPPDASTLAHVFREEQEALARRTLMLTLANICDMLRAPIAAQEWWAPTRIRGFVNASRVREFDELTDARLSGVRGRDRVRVVRGLSIVEYEVATPPSGDGLDALVWWSREDAGVDGTMPLLGFYGYHRRARTLTEWRSIVEDKEGHAPLGVFSFDERVTWSGTCEWPQGAVDVARDDPEARAVVRMSAQVSLAIGSPEKVVTPWGEIETAVSRTLQERLDLAVRAKELSTFAYEVPFVVDADEVVR